VLQKRYKISSHKLRPRRPQVSHRPPQFPPFLQFSRDLSPEEVSHAWEYLYNLPEPTRFSPEPPEPPEELHHLSAVDWLLLSNLLHRELDLRDSQPQH
jgi:hypothetical protein